MKIKATITRYSPLPDRNGMVLTKHALQQIASQFTKEIPVLEQFDASCRLGVCIYAELIDGTVIGTMQLNENGVAYLKKTRGVSLQYAVPGFRIEDESVSHAATTCTIDNLKLVAIGLTPSPSENELTPIEEEKDSK